MRTTMIGLAIFAVVSVSQAANLWSQTDGAWTNATTVWNTTADGTGTWQAPAYTTNTATGDNLFFNHEITIESGVTGTVRAVIMQPGGSISVDPGGTVILNREVVYKVNDTWDSTDWIFNVQPAQRFAWQQYFGDTTWIHNGDLNLNTGGDSNDQIKFWARGEDPSSVTFAGTGLLTLQELEIGISSYKIDVFVDRDLTTELIENRGGFISLDLMSGTTTTDEIFVPGAGSTIKLSGEEAVLNVSTNSLTVAQAEAAILAGSITNSFNGGEMAVVEVDGYTRISVGAAPPLPPPGDISIQVDGSNLIFTWSGVEQGTYALQGTTDLTDGVWSNMIENIPGALLVTVTNPIPSAPEMFNRAAVE